MKSNQVQETGNNMPKVFKTAQRFCIKNPMRAIREAPEPY